MRNASFLLTEQQILNETKTVTRRLNWLWAKVGMLLQAIRKGMGRKAGEPIVKLKVIQIVEVRREPLNALLDVMHYMPEAAEAECRMEGFPELTPEEFVKMFCREMNCKPNRMITRVKFHYVKEAAI